MRAALLVSYLIKQADRTLQSQPLVLLLVGVLQLQYDKDTNMYSTQRQIDYERQRTKEREAEQRTKLIHGMILAPIMFLGWFPILWILSKFLK